MFWLSYYLLGVAFGPKYRLYHFVKMPRLPLIQLSALGLFVALLYPASAFRRLDANSSELFLDKKPTVSKPTPVVPQEVKPVETNSRPDPSDKPWLHRAQNATQYCNNRRLTFENDLLPRELVIESGRNVDIVNDTLVLTMEKVPGKNYGRSVTLVNGPYFTKFGSVSAEIRTSKIPGVIFSFIVRAEGQEEGRDEIDLEWLGGSTREVTTNIFSNGHVIYAIYGRRHTIPGDSEDWHRYTISWGEDEIVWSIDGQTIRVWKAVNSWNEDVKDWIFPVNPMRLEFGLWDATASGRDGTIQWAGGPVSWEKYPDGVTMEVRNIQVTCSNENTPSPAAYRKARESIRGQSQSLGNRFFGKPEEGTSDGTSLVHSWSWGQLPIIFAVLMILLF